MDMGVTSERETEVVSSKEEGLCCKEVKTTHLLLNCGYPTHLWLIPLIWYLPPETPPFELNIKHALRMVAMVFWSQSPGLWGMFLW